MLEHGLRTPTGHIARQTRRIDEIRPRMTVVEEEVSWLRSQFAEDLHQMHQEPDLLQLPVRASMGSLELHSDAMGLARRLRRPCARRIGEVPKGARLPVRPMLPPSRTGHQTPGSGPCIQLADLVSGISRHHSCGCRNSAPPTLWSAVRRST